MQRVDTREYRICDLIHVHDLVLVNTLVFFVVNAVFLFICSALGFFYILPIFIVASFFSMFLIAGNRSGKFVFYIPYLLVFVIQIGVFAVYIVFFTFFHSTFKRNFTEGGIIAFSDTVYYLISAVVIIFFFVYLFFLYCLFRDIRYVRKEMKGVPEVQSFMYHPYWTARPPIHVSPSGGSAAAPTPQYPQPVQSYQPQPPQPYAPYGVDPVYGFGGDIAQHHYHHEAKIMDNTMNTIPTNDQHGAAPPSYQESNVHHNPCYQPDVGSSINHHSHGYVHPASHDYGHGQSSGHGGY